MSRTLSGIALANETRDLLERLKVRQEYLPRKIDSQNKAGARAEEWFKTHDLPDDLPPDESPESTKSKKKAKKTTATKKSTKRVTKKPKKKKNVHPEPTVDELLEDTGADWPQEARHIVRILKMQDHPCGHLESQICNCEEWSKQPAEVELRIVEGLVDYLETASGDLSSIRFLVPAVCPNSDRHPDGATAFRRLRRPMYRVGVRTSLLRLRTRSDWRVEREEIIPHGVIEARFTFFPYGVSDFGQAVGHRNTAGICPVLYHVQVLQNVLGISDLRFMGE